MLSADRPTWRTSSFTNAGEPCVEVAELSDGVRVRDSKDCGTGPRLSFTHDEWASFLTAAVAGRPIPTVTMADAITRHRHTSVATRWHVSSRQSLVPLHFTDPEWTAFLAGARAGEFDFTPARQEPVLVAL